jgi:hypothetical protein
VLRRNRSTDQIFRIDQILEKMSKLESTSSVQRLEDSPRFNEEGIIVQSSHRVLDTHEISQVD